MGDKKILIACAFQMANLGSQVNGPLGYDRQDDAQNDDARNDSLVVVDALQNQNLASTFERLFTTIYPFQSGVMSNLSRLEFKNLLLAGVRTPISHQLQKKHLIPSKCDEVLTIAGIGPVTCPNTTQTVDEIKACHGMHHDGWGLRGRQETWIEPMRLFKHVRGSTALVMTSNDNEGGHFDSFNVCIHCHDRDRQCRRPCENFTISQSRTVLCLSHTLEYAERRPHNACRCKMFLEKYWRCNVCSLDTLDELKMRAQSFGELPFPNFIFDKAAGLYLDRASGTRRRRDVCPILGCTGPPWLSGPPDKQILLCRACTAIFPRPL